ncbi:hypothetical protein [Paraburkholderia megapolitana]|uniref:hypothetical protein n=1 Tax=Paraburkholderia megapolitana TaxID=420953 RepID=UPI0038B715E9
MTTKAFRQVLFIAGLLVTGNVAIAQTCHYSEVDPGAGKVSARHVTIDLGSGDPSEKPTAWIGPMSLTGPSGKSCSVDPDVSIIERPIYTDGQHVFVTTYSGSNRVVYAIDATSCDVLWKSASFSGPVKLSGNRLRLDKQTVKLGPDCVPAH